jgi:hypothetical protein
MESVEICPLSKTGAIKMPTRYEICRIQATPAQLIKLTAVVGCLLGNLAISTHATAIPPALVKEYEEWGLTPPPSAVAADKTSIPDDGWSEPSPVSDDNASSSAPREQGDRQKALVGQWQTSDMLVDGKSVVMWLSATINFDEQGGFRLNGTEILDDGEESEFTSRGTFRIEGNTLLLDTQQGPRQSAFSLVGERMYLKLPGTDITVVFVRK